MKRLRLTLALIAATLLSTVSLPVAMADSPLSEEAIRQHLQPYVEAVYAENPPEQRDRDIVETLYSNSEGRRLYRYFGRFTSATEIEPYVDSERGVYDVMAHLLANGRVRVSVSSAASSNWWFSGVRFSYRYEAPSETSEPLDDEVVEAWVGEHLIDSSDQAGQIPSFTQADDPLTYRFTVLDWSEHQVKVLVQAYSEDGELLSEERGDWEYVVLLPEPTPEPGFEVGSGGEPTASPEPESESATPGSALQPAPAVTPTVPDDLEPSSDSPSAAPQDSQQLPEPVSLSPPEEAEVMAHLVAYAPHGLGEPFGNVPDMSDEQGNLYGFTLDYNPDTGAGEAQVSAYSPEGDLLSGEAGWTYSFELAFEPVPEASTAPAEEPAAVPTGEADRASELLGQGQAEEPTLTASAAPAVAPPVREADQASTSHTPGYNLVLVALVATAVLVASAIVMVARWLKGRRPAQPVTASLTGSQLVRRESLLAQATTQSTDDTEVQAAAQSRPVRQSVRQGKKPVHAQPPVVEVDDRPTEAIPVYSITTLAEDFKGFGA